MKSLIIPLLWNNHKEIAKQMFSAFFLHFVSDTKSRSYWIYCFMIWLSYVNNFIYHFQAISSYSTTYFNDFMVFHHWYISRFIQQAFYCWMWTLNHYSMIPQWIINNKKFNLTGSLRLYMIFPNYSNSISLGFASVIVNFSQIEPLAPGMWLGLSYSTHVIPLLTCIHLPRYRAIFY